MLPRESRKNAGQAPAVELTIEVGELRRVEPHSELVGLLRGQECSGFMCEGERQLRGRKLVALREAVDVSVALVVPRLQERAATELVGLRGNEMGAQKHGCHTRMRIGRAHTHIYTHNTHTTHTHTHATHIQHSVRHNRRTMSVSSVAGPVPVGYVHALDRGCRSVPPLRVNTKVDARMMSSLVT